MINAIRERLTVTTPGQLTISSPELEQGADVEVLILLENGQEEMDATDYLLSTEANRRRMYEALEELKHPENFIPLDIDEYEKRLTES